MSGKGGFSGRVALITGGASGIGAATAHALTADGARVVIADVDETRAHAVRTALGAEAAVAIFDVAEEPGWVRAIADVNARFGRLDFLVNCAGVGGGKPVETEDLAHWDLVWRSNVTGVFLGCKHAIGLIDASGGGAIVNIASAAGRKPLAEMPAYCAAKAAVLHLTRSVALHCAKAGYNIRCNSVLPGITDTPRLAYREGQFGGRQEMLDALVKQFHPLGHALQPDEIARGVLYLLSDDAKHVTGIELPIDAGFQL